MRVLPGAAAADKGRRHHMKKFHFQLDTVLGYKQQVLDNRLVEHGAAVAQVTRQEAVLDDARNRRSDYEAEFEQKKTEGMTMFEALKYQHCMQALVNEVERETERLARLRRIEEEKRARVVESRVETKTLEKLKEIKLQDYNHAIQKDEERFIDDLTATKRVLSNA